MTALCCHFLYIYRNPYICYNKEEEKLGGIMENKQTEYSSKYFLTGLLLGSGILLLIAMVFSFLFIINVTHAIANPIILFGLVIVTLLLYLFFLHKTERVKNFKWLAFYFVLTIATLGLLSFELIYVLIQVSILLIFTGNLLLIFIGYIFTLYFIGSFVFSIIALFITCFELFDIDNRNFKMMYAINFIFIVVILFMLNGFTITNILAAIYIVIMVAISAFYVLWGYKYGPVKMNIETIEDRYIFVIKAIVYASIIPIQLPKYVIKTFKRILN